jgi:hypothetical protein
MKISAVVDTGFLISLVDRNRPCHTTANQYYKYCIAQAEERKAQYLISEDENTFKAYVEQLRADNKIRFSFISIQQKFDVALINGTGQAELDIRQ